MRPRSGKRRDGKRSSARDRVTRPDCRYRRHRSRKTPTMHTGCTAARNSDFAAGRQAAVSRESVRATTYPRIEARKGNRMYFLRDHCPSPGFPAGRRPAAGKTGRNARRNRSCKKRRNHAPAPPGESPYRPVKALPGGGKTGFSASDGGRPTLFGRERAGEPIRRTAAQIEYVSRKTGGMYGNPSPAGRRRSG